MNINLTETFQTYIQRRGHKTPLAVWQDETGLYAKFSPADAPQATAGFSQVFSDIGTVRLSMRDLDNPYIVSDEGVKLFRKALNG